MRPFLILGFLVFQIVESPGQGEVKGKIFINGQEFSNEKWEQKYFDFKPMTAKLSRNGKKYLDSFAHKYSTTTEINDSLKIIVDPGQTLKEMKIVNNRMGLARAWTALNYLKNKHGIEIPNAVVHETYTACILAGTIDRRQRRTKGK